MQIHFVCLGNTYRSRMAQAIFNSKSVSGWEATSSGAFAYMDECGPISWYAKEILEEKDLLRYTTSNWTDCSPQLLERADKIIFMHPEVLTAYKDRFGRPTKEYEVWEIPDLHPAGMSEAEVRQTAHDTFDKIKEKINTLISKL